MFLSLLATSLKTLIAFGLPILPKARAAWCLTNLSLSVWRRFIKESTAFSSPMFPNIKINSDFKIGSVLFCLSFLISGFTSLKLSIAPIAIEAWYRTPSFTSLKHLINTLEASLGFSFWKILQAASLNLVLVFFSRSEISSWTICSSYFLDKTLMAASRSFFDSLYNCNTYFFVFSGIDIISSQNGTL